MENNKYSLVKRPHPGETEEDILAMQDDFMKQTQNNTITPSAKVINIRKHKTDDQPSTDNIKQSKYAKDKNLKPKKSVNFDNTTSSPPLLGDIKENQLSKENIADDPIYYPSVNSQVLGEIIEKNLPSVEQFHSKVSVQHKGFPSTDEYDITSKSSQEETKITPSSSSSGMIESSSADSNVNVNSFGDNSAILFGNEASEIHQRNTNLLSTMSEREILEEKEKLMSTMDPTVLSYVKSLRNKKNTPPSEEVEQMVVDQTTAKPELIENEVITHPNVTDWLHFDTLECEKLEWIKNMEQVSVNNQDKSYEARFDFKGRLLPYSIEYSEETKTLFHHGEEPHRPGYTLSELFELCRSTVHQQRSVALNTIAGILQYYTAGRYVNVISLPITKIFFVLRFALDENAPITLEPCLKALRNLLYNQIDECLLDFFLGANNGLIQPILIPHKTETEETDCEDSEIKDFHMAELDLIAGCIRTNIFNRIRYIFSVMKPDFSCVEYCMQILIRLARSNQEIDGNFTTSHDLLTMIVNYLPAQVISIPSAGDVALVQSWKLALVTLKLIRILVTRSKVIASLLVSKHDLFSVLSAYAGSVLEGTLIENTLYLKIQIETYYLWSTLLFYGYGLTQMNELKFVLLRSLDFHSKVTDVSEKYPIIMHSHATAVITLLHCCSTERKRNLSALHASIIQLPAPMIMATWKWSSQITTIDKVNSGHLLSLSAALLYLAHEFTPTCDDMRNSQVNVYVLKMMHSPGYDKILDSIKSSSNLLSELTVDEEVKCSNNPGLSSSFLSKHCDLPPTASANSPFCLLAALSKYILSVNVEALTAKFVFNIKMITYLHAVSSSKSLSLTDNWFTRIEIMTLLNILQCVVNFKCTDDQREFFYNLAFKLSYIVSPEFKSQIVFILERIIFNRNWFSTEKLLENMSLYNSNIMLENLSRIHTCYVKILQLNQISEKSNLVSDNWEMTVLPRDWMFMPIVGLYAKSQDRETLTLRKDIAAALEEDIKDVIVCSLNWILISEIYFPEVTKEISLTDRFCRLSCVFLCSNSAFLDNEVQTLLLQCFKMLYKIENIGRKSQKFNFDAPLIGINSFSELYTQLVNQFQAVSYGNPVFASCILVPLAQRHNISWRKIVWSEFASCLRALDCPEEDLCYEIERYLIPTELDFSLLKCYHRALTSNLLRADSVPYKIANHHVVCAKMRQERKNKKSDP